MLDGGNVVVSRTAALSVDRASSVKKWGQTVRLDLHRSVSAAAPASATNDKSIGRIERIRRIAPTGPKERSRNEPGGKGDTLGTRKESLPRVFPFIRARCASALYAPWNNPTNPFNPPDRLLLSSLRPALGSLRPALQQNAVVRVRRARIPRCARNDGLLGRVQNPENPPTRVVKATRPRVFSRAMASAAIARPMRSPTSLSKR